MVSFCPDSWSQSAVIGFFPVDEYLAVRVKDLQYGSYVMAVSWRQKLDEVVYEGIIEDFNQNRPCRILLGSPLVSLDFF